MVGTDLLSSMSKGFALSSGIGPASGGLRVGVNELLRVHCIAARFSSCGMRWPLTKQRLGKRQCYSCKIKRRDRF